MVRDPVVHSPVTTGAATFPLRSLYTQVTLDGGQEGLQAFPELRLVGFAQGERHVGRGELGERGQQPLTQHRVRLLRQETANELRVVELGRWKRESERLSEWVSRSESWGEWASGWASRRTSE